MLNRYNLSSSHSLSKALQQNLVAITLGSLIFLTACGGSDSAIETDVAEEVTTETTDTTTEITDTDFEVTDWTEATHSKSAEPNFEEVFDDSQVKRLDFVVTEERWQSMLDDMTATYGEFGQRSNSNGLVDTDENPIFVPADVYYQDTQWYRVGIRFKGNSSLQSGWQSGILKLSFKLDFDEFEDCLLYTSPSPRD